MEQSSCQVSQSLFVTWTRRSRAYIVCNNLPWPLFFWFWSVRFFVVLIMCKLCKVTSSQLRWCGWDVQPTLLRNFNYAVYSFVGRRTIHCQSRYNTKAKRNIRQLHNSQRGGGVRLSGPTWPHHTGLDPRKLLGLATLVHCNNSNTPDAKDTCFWFEWIRRQDSRVPLESSSLNIFVCSHARSWFFLAIKWLTCFLKVTFRLGRSLPIICGNHIYCSYYA